MSELRSGLTAIWAELRQRESDRTKVERRRSGLSKNDGGTRVERRYDFRFRILDLGRFGLSQKKGGTAVEQGRNGGDEG